VAKPSEGPCHWRLRSLDQRACAVAFSKTLSVHPPENRYPALFRAGEGEGEEWQPNPVTPFPVRIDSLTAIPHDAIG